MCVHKVEWVCANAKMFGQHMIARAFFIGVFKILETLGALKNAFIFPFTDPPDTKCNIRCYKTQIRQT
jgi:hypothetical protein